jgi:hypothetical protein
MKSYKPETTWFKSVNTYIHAITVSHVQLILGRKNAHEQFQCQWLKCYRVISWWYMIHDTWHMMPDTWCLIHDAWYIMPDTWCLIHDAWYMMPDTWCLIHDAWYMMPDTW